MKTAIAGCALLASISSSAFSEPIVTSEPGHVTSGFLNERLDQNGLGVADDGQARVLMSYALNLIKDFEQWVPRLYNDASNYCTIGYGHLIARKPCASVDRAVLSRFPNPMGLDYGSNLLNTDSASAREEVSSVVKVDLNDQQFGALVSFVFNVGATKFEKSTLLKAINNREFEAVPRQFARWIISGGKPLNGLINRRACEAALFKGDLPSSQSQSFDRQECASLGAASEVSDPIDIQVGE